MSRLEWDDEKYEINLKKHGIRFETAARIFTRPYLEIWDEDHSGFNKYGEWEDRYTAIGWVEDVLYVCYTIRNHDDDEYIRLISARLADATEMDLYFRWLNGQR